MRILTVSPWHEREIADVSAAIKVRDSILDAIHSEFGAIAGRTAFADMDRETCGVSAMYVHFRQRDFVAHRLATLRG
jgi:hypothetical protein